MVETTIHRGLNQDISTTASAGLLWIKAFGPLFDSIDSNTAKRALEYLTPDCKFAFNGLPGISQAQMIAIMEKVKEPMRVYDRQTTTAWDVDNGDGTRTVMVESVLVKETEGDKSTVPQFNIAELAKQEDGSWKATDLRTYLDFEDSAFRQAIIQMTSQ
jgi:hypothetical protein